MRFPTVVTRYVGSAPAGGIALGADGTLGTPPTAPPDPTKNDNLMSVGRYSNQGWPAHRVGVSFKYTGGGSAPATLNAQIWFFERATNSWYLLEATKALKPNQITFFDIVSLIDSPTTMRDMSASQGGVDVFLMVEATGTPANGTYTFGMGADLTPLAV